MVFNIFFYQFHAYFIKSLKVFNCTTFPLFVVFCAQCPVVRCLINLCVIARCLIVLDSSIWHPPFGLKSTHYTCNLTDILDMPLREMLFSCLDDYLGSSVSSYMFVGRVQGVWVGGLYTPRGGLAIYGQ